MVLLGCGVLGDASVFQMEANRESMTVDLRESIYNKKRYGDVYWFDESALKLYAAKKANGEWLRSGEELDALLERGLSDDTEYARMDPLLPLDHEANLGAVFPIDSNTIHVLVRLPPRPKSALDQRGLEIHDMLLYHVLVDTPSSSMAAAPSDYFKQQLVEAYLCKCPVPPVAPASPTSTLKAMIKTKRKTNGRDPLRCMLLNMALPADFVSAAHLFQRSNAFMVEPFMRFHNIDDVRNGLLLFEPLKEALDRFQVCFMYDMRRDEYRFKVLDGELLSRRLIDTLANRQREFLLDVVPAPAVQGLQYRTVKPEFDLRAITFGDLEGRALCFASRERPYRRCVRLHARLALEKAARERWIEHYNPTFANYLSGCIPFVEKMDLARDK